MRSGWKEEKPPRACRLRRLVKRLSQKACDRRQHAVIHFLLVRSQRLQRRLRNHERMVASLDDGERRGRVHPLPNTFEKVERAERVARSLREQDRRLQFHENLIAEPRSVASTAKWIAETDDRFDRIDEGDMAADAPAHTFAGEHDRPGMLGAKRGKRCSMRFDELGQRVRPPPALQGIRVIKRLDRTDRTQEPREGLHSRVRGWGARARREEKGRTGHERQFIGSGKPRQPALPFARRGLADATLWLHQKLAATELDR